MSEFQLVTEITSTGNIKVFTVGEINDKINDLMNDISFIKSQLSALQSNGLVSNFKDELKKHLEIYLTEKIESKDFYLNCLVATRKNVENMRGKSAIVGMDLSLGDDLTSLNFEFDI